MSAIIPYIYRLCQNSQANPQRTVEGSATGLLSRHLRTRLSGLVDVRPRDTSIFSGLLKGQQPVQDGIEHCRFPLYDD